MNKKEYIQTACLSWIEWSETKLIWIDVWVKTLFTLSDWTIYKFPPDIIEWITSIQKLVQQVESYRLDNLDITYIRETNKQINNIIIPLKQKIYLYYNKVLTNIKYTYTDIYMEDLDIYYMQSISTPYRVFLDFIDYYYILSILKPTLVDATLSSRKCSKCWTIVNAWLWTRTFNCTKCNLSIDRDLNAAIVISKATPI